MSSATPVIAASVPAIPWNAAGADSLNMTVLGAYPVGLTAGAWDCAGYVDPRGREFAIVGADSLHIVDLADPRRPQRVAAFVVPRPPDINFFVAVEVDGVYAYAGARFGPILTSEESAARLQILSAGGRRVRSLAPVPGEGGEYRWDGLDERGQQVPRGVYFLRLDGEVPLRGRVVVVP